MCCEREETKAWQANGLTATDWCASAAMAAGREESLWDDGGDDGESINDKGKIGPYLMGCSSTFGEKDFFQFFFYDGF